MSNITAKTLVTLAMLFACVHLLSGCEPPPVTAREIDRANEEVVGLLRSALLLSRAATGSVDAAYRELSLYINANQLSLPELTAMEDHLSTAKGEAARLREMLKSA